MSNLKIKERKCDKCIIEGDPTSSKHMWLIFYPEDMILSDTGKWLCFFNHDEIDKKWALVKEKFNKNNLGSVIGMKVSTVEQNHGHREKDLVIVFYCNNSSDKESIIKTGNIIKEEMNYNKNMYYKTNLQTRSCKSCSSYRIEHRETKYLFID